MIGVYIVAGLLTIFLIMSTRMHKQANCNHSYLFHDFSRYSANWGVGGSYPFLTIVWKCEHCGRKVEGETAYAFDVPEDEEQRLYDLPPMSEFRVSQYEWPYEYKRMNPE